jgi:hypothetical protein
MFEMLLLHVSAVQEERLPMEPVVNTTFPVLLPMLQQLLAAPANSSDQVWTACASQQPVAACTGCLWTHLCWCGFTAARQLSLLIPLEEHQRHWPQMISGHAA